MIYQLGWTTLPGLEAERGHCGFVGRGFSRAVQAAAGQAALAAEGRTVAKILRRVRQAGVYFVTSRTWQSRTIFNKPGPAQILLEQIVDCRERGFYRLHAFVIMPDHFHALLTPGEGTSLEKAMQMIKGSSAHRLHEELSYVWPVWQKGFHDRWMRNATEFQARRQYIETNPVAARLAVRPAEYLFSSASGEVALDPSRFDQGSLSG